MVIFHCYVSSPEGKSSAIYGGFHSHGATPLSLEGVFQGKSQSKMGDNWGNYAYDLGNLHDESHTA